MEDRFGAPPDAARRLVKLMALKTELRRLRALGCEANARVVTLHLREDTPLDPAKVTALIRRTHGAWKLTPDMRLTRRFDGAGNAPSRHGPATPPAEGGDGIANAEAMLAELAGCLKDA
jgi:transcription-repair coupling factor (superfamily II helicase)